MLVVPMMALFVLSTPHVHGQNQPGLVHQGMIFDRVPFESCHASSIEQNKYGNLVVTWFAGIEEGSPDVGIWVSILENGVWSKPVEVANGVDEKNNRRYPTWNPVLFKPSSGPLKLYYKVGPSPREWWGMVKESHDGGITWRPAERLKKGYLGPIKNKPIELENGVILCGSSTEDAGWLVHMERGRQLGKYWEKTDPLHNALEVSAIQPTVLNWGADGIQILCRTKQKEIVEFWSKDKGITWAGPRFTGMPNSNSGLDAVKLRDGRALMVYNHTKEGRTPLNVAVTDNGKDWYAALVLENDPGEYSYPAVIQTYDGMVHVTYTWRRTHIRHCVIDPNQLDLRLMKNAVWR